MKTKNIAEMRQATKDHVASDRVVQGTYWEDGKGCFIGCLTHSSKAENVQEKYGIPLPLVYVLEGIFEGLPAHDCASFFGDVAEAIEVDGKDLSLVVWAFLAAELRQLPTVDTDSQAAIDTVIGGMDILAAGGEWDRKAAYAAAAVAEAYTVNAAVYAAANAATYATYAANAANAAAYVAANAAANAANAATYAASAAYAAAYADTRKRQAATMLELMAGEST